ncbi:MAG: hypothetical protein GDA67_15570 [Nitrospira sp. CR1.3]|nr:hypothetical protein [Nitrospira sp. CR1.3]
MKYQIALSLTQLSRGTFVVDAPTPGGAECLARLLKAGDVAEWRLMEENLTVLSITPAMESNGCRYGTTELLPDEVLEAMHKVVDYLFEDAAEDYPTAEHRSGHIFEDVATLDRWLGGPTTRHSRSKLTVDPNL